MSAADAHNCALQTETHAKSKSWEAIFFSRGHAFPMLVITVLYVIAILFIGVGGEFPIIDDWVYVKDCRDFLHTGNLLLQGSSASCYMHILIGALVSHFTGVSYESLRCTELLISFIGAAALYFSLCEIGLSRRNAVLFCLAYVLNPYTLYLSFSFMTDVTALTFVNLYLLCMIKAMKRQKKSAWIVAGAISLIAAIAVRQTAAMAVLVNIALLPLLKRRRGDLPLLITGLVVAPIAVTVTLTALLLQEERFGSLVLGFHSANFQLFMELLLKHPPRALSQFMVKSGELAWYLGLLSSPVVISIAYEQIRRKQRVAPSCWLTAAFIVCWAMFTIVCRQGCLIPFNHGLRQPPWFEEPWMVGQRSCSFLGYEGAYGYKITLSILTVFSTIMGFCMLTAVLSQVRAMVLRAVRRRFQIHTNAFRSAYFSALTALSCIVMLALQITVIRDADRYYVIALPPVLLCLAVVMRYQSDKFHLWISLSISFLLTGYSLVAVQDSMNTHRAQLCAIKSLEESGVNPLNIDEGWPYDLMVNDNLYYKRSCGGGDTFPIEARGQAGLNKQRWWAVNGEEYLISWSEIPGYEVVSRHPYNTFFRQKHAEIFALKRKKN